MRKAILETALSVQVSCSCTCKEGYTGDGSKEGCTGYSSQCSSKLVHMTYVYVNMLHLQLYTFAHEYIYMCVLVNICVDLNSVNLFLW